MDETRKQIIAVGGGGFSSEPENPALDLYLLEQARGATPAVCFLPTASGDDAAYIASFYAAFTRYECHPSHLSFFSRTPDLRSLLLRQDVIYVGGGNTKSMLAVWRDWGLPELLKEACQSGVLLAGVSAGAICWFEQGLTDSYEEELAALDCLGFLSGSCSPHYDGEPERRPAYHRLLLEDAVSPGYAVDDGAAVHFVDGQLHRVVSWRTHAKAYRVSRASQSVVEEALEVRRLDDADQA